LSLGSGDFVSYQHHRELLLGNYGATKDPDIAADLARLSLAEPMSGEELNTVSNLVEIASAARIREGTAADYKPYYGLIRSLLEYRSGRYARAIDHAEKNLARASADGEDPEARLVLGMACWQVGQESRAQACLAKAKESIGEQRRAGDAADIGADFPSSLLERALEREATGLMGAAGAPKPGK
jgi:hypothetical protein